MKDKKILNLKQLEISLEIADMGCIISPMSTKKPYNSPTFEKTLMRFHKLKSKRHSLQPITSNKIL